MGKLRHYHAALNNVASAPVDIVFLGDSVTEFNLTA